MNELNLNTYYPLFSKVIYESKIDEEKLSNISSLIKDTKFKDSMQGDNLASTSINQNILDLKKLLNLKKDILKKFITFSKEILHYKNNFQITTSWIAKIEKNGYGHFHNHRNSFYSGILYLKVNEKSGDVIFRNTNTNSFILQPEKYNVYNSDQWRFKPKNGSIYFFPSELFHQVEKNNSDEIRYSLSFNIIPKGDVGFKDNDSYLNLK